MRKTAISIVLLVLLIGLYVLSQAQDTANHERVHALNCEYHGGTATIEYGFLWQNGVTYCGNTELDDNIREQQRILDVQNEIVGYNISSLIDSLFVISFIFLCLFVSIWLWD